MSLPAETANIAWMLITAALVMLMQAGFCCLESGFARAKNSINVAIKNLSDFCVASLLFWLCGFAFMFGQDAGGLIGTSHFMISGQETPWFLAFFLFQLVFCGTSTTIVSGAVAERMRFSAYLIVSAIISALIYPVIGHWAWGGVVEGTGKGWLAQLGFIDFAGSTVVHSTGGWVALAAVLLIGPRIGKYNGGTQKIHGYDYPMSMLGVMLLWFGWFGFNGGSTLVLNGSVPLIMVNTNLAAAAGGASGMALGWMYRKRADVGDIINGVIAGLVGITASCHIQTPAAAILIGALAGTICLAAMELLEWLQVDDVVGAIPVHGFCGAWGTLAVALFADPAKFDNGLTRWQQLGVQSLGVLCCFAWSTVVTLVTLGLLNRVYRLRVTPKEELQGLNVSEHGANTELIDLLAEMRRQGEDGDFAQPVPVEPHTEVGQIAAEYNKVLGKVVGEIEYREDLVKQLRVAEEKYRSIFEHASEGIFRFGPNGRFLDANPALAQILGYPDPQTLVAEVLDIRTQLYVDPKSRYRLMEELTANAKALNFETQLYRRDGSAVDVSLSARMVVGVSGQYEYIEGSLCDITQRREFEKFLQEKEAAEAANRAKSAFLATMSHEIRTPLNGVIGMLELLSNSHLSEKQTRYTSIAKSSAQALLSLINDILDFSKIEAGKLELHQTDFDLLMLLEEIADMFGHRAEQKGLELSCHVLPDVPVRVYGDSERLRQVLINLVGNSLKFTERGEVRIRSKLLSAVNGRRTVRFEVEDTGVGIPPEVQSRLFQVFEQADSSTTRKYGGTGLGLAICRQLVELMGGKIGVTSKLGEGSQFWCEVPFEGANTPQPRRASEIRFRGLRVIAVDDNDTNLQIIETQLTNWGAEVVTARSAADALHILKLAHVQGQKFDLGILDHQMPEVDGVELAKRIHGDPNFQHILMIMLTSSDSPGEPKFLRSVGIRACCTKPILQSRLFDVLISTLHAAEHGPRLEHQPAAEESEAVGESTPAAAAPTGEARRILIADDNEINQMVSQEIIEKAGYQCRIANNGQEALDLLKKRYFDVVLMDCQMPVMDGFTAVKEIRRLQAAGQLPDSLPDPLPVIALTANAVAGDRERCLAAGMTDYVTKPVDPEQLLKVIGKLLPQTAGADIQTPESAPTPPAASEPAPVDWKALRDRCGGDGQFARRVIEKFHNRLGEDLKKIQSACQRRDFEESRRLAHSLKGSSSSVAATAVSESAAAIEMAAKSAAAEDVDRHLQELKGRVDRCLSYVAQNLDQAL